MNTHAPNSHHQPCSNITIGSRSRGNVVVAVGLQPCKVKLEKVANH